MKITAYSNPRFDQGQNSPPLQSKGDGEPKNTRLFDWRSTLFTYLGTCIHECGHAMAAYFLYKNANPKIYVTLTGGRCTYNSGTLSSFGAQIGKSYSTALVAAAGPLVDIALLLGITKLSCSDKKTARLMLCRAISVSLYALSALLFCSEGHDYCGVWKNAGIFAYGSLAAASLATTALVYRNATRQVGSRLFYKDLEISHGASDANYLF